MKIGRGISIQRHLGQIFEGRSVAGLGEVQLLERYVEHRDELAFTTLVARHGPMVLGVCRRLLVDPLDVEDAFQATFLVLARRAGSLKDRDRLAPWLFGVARRVATRARADLSRRRSREGSGVEEIAAVADRADPNRELGEALVEEIDRLPAVLREPILLCYVEGLSYDEAAARLRSTAPAIRGRLARAKGRLKDRLTRRGFAPTVTSLGVWLVGEGASAAVPSQLLMTTIRLAKAGAVPAVVDILAEGVIRTMILTKSKILTAAVVACGIAGSSLGLRAQAPVSPTAESKTAETTKTAKVDPPTPPKRTDGADATALSLIEALSKIADLQDLSVTVKVSSDGEALEKLDPATRALVDAALKGVDIKNLKGNAEVVQKDGKTMIIVPGQVTIEDHSAPSPTASAREEALEAKLKRLEARIEELEKKGSLPPSGSTPK